MRNTLVIVILSVNCAVFPFVSRSQNSEGASFAAVEILPQRASTVTDSVGRKKSLISRIIDYFDDTNKPHPYKKFDFSMLGGPHYSSDAGFGIGLLAAGLYRTNMADTLLPPSSVTLFADATTKLHFAVGIEGYHILPGDRYRINYLAQFDHQKTKFWGIGYAYGNNADNESSIKFLQALVQSDVSMRIGSHLYVGPMVRFSYVYGRDFEKPELLDGEPTHSLVYGAGLKICYDCRDFPGNPYKGLYLSLEQVFNPRFIGNSRAYSSTELTAASYNRVWKGGVIASSLHSRLSYGDTPWGELSSLGVTGGMRGYFPGRYRDKCCLDLCVELRQHVWRRSGAVVWVGAGTVFPKFSELRIKHFLPECGVGYRWEFKNRVNVRLDLGIGRHNLNFMFNINEAF